MLPETPTDPDDPRRAARVACERLEGIAGEGASTATRRAAASVVLGLYEAWRNTFGPEGPSSHHAWTWLDEAMGLTGLGPLPIPAGRTAASDRVVAEPVTRLSTPEEWGDAAALEVQAALASLHKLLAAGRT